MFCGNDLDSVNSCSLTDETTGWGVFFFFFFFCEDGFHSSSGPLRRVYLLYKVALEKWLGFLKFLEPSSALRMWLTFFNIFIIVNKVHEQTKTNNDLIMLKSIICVSRLMEPNEAFLVVVQQLLKMHHYQPHWHVLYCHEHTNCSLFSIHTVLLK